MEIVFLLFGIATEISFEYIRFKLLPVFRKQCSPVLAEIGVLLCAGTVCSLLSAVPGLFLNNELTGRNCPYVFYGYVMLLGIVIGFGLSRLLTRVGFLKR